MYYLKHEQECFIRYKDTSAKREWLCTNKTRHASVLNDFKNICIIKPNLYIKIFI